MFPCFFMVEYGWLPNRKLVAILSGGKQSALAGRYHPRERSNQV